MSFLAVTLCMVTHQPAAAAAAAAPATAPAPASSDGCSPVGGTACGAGAGAGSDPGAGEEASDMLGPCVLSGLRPMPSPAAKPPITANAITTSTMHASRLSSQTPACPTLQQHPPSMSRMFSVAPQSQISALHDKATSCSGSSCYGRSMHSVHATVEASNCALRKVL
jgi:hypothetical protein